MTPHVSQCQALGEQLRVSFDCEVIVLSCGHFAGDLSRAVSRLPFQWIPAANHTVTPGLPSFVHAAASSDPVVTL